MHNCYLTGVQYTVNPITIYLFVTPNLDVLGELKVPFTFTAINFGNATDVPLIIVRGKFFMSRAGHAAGRFALQNTPPPVFCPVMAQSMDIVLFQWPPVEKTRMFSSPHPHQSTPPPRETSPTPRSR